MRQDFHKTFDSNFEKNSLQRLVGGGICDSILDNVDKLNNLNENIHIEVIYLEQISLGRKYEKDSDTDSRNIAGYEYSFDRRKYLSGSGRGST